jgi:hypothetical protein
MATVWDIKCRNEKVALGRSKNRWKHTVKMDYKVIGKESSEEIHLAENRDHCVKPSGSIIFIEALDPVRDSLLAS